MLSTSVDKEDIKIVKMRFTKELTQFSYRMSEENGIKRSERLSNDPFLKEHLSLGDFLASPCFLLTCQNVCEIKNLSPSCQKAKGKKDLKCISRLETTLERVHKALRHSSANKKALSTSIISLTH